MPINSSCEKHSHTLKTKLKSAMSTSELLCRSKILPSQLRLTAHTTYYSSFFLLRTPVTINGQPAQVGCSSEGELTLSCRYPSLSLPLHSIQASLEEVVKTCGVSRVGDVHCEEVPLFPVTFSSEHNLRKFLINRESAQQQLESLFPVRFPTHDQQAARDQPTSDQQPVSDPPTSDRQPGSVQPTSDQQPGSDQPTSDQQPGSDQPTSDQQPGGDHLTSDQQAAGIQQPASDQLPTHVQLQLFLVRPDAVTKDARVVEVTLENHSACMALLKESEMFDYRSLFQAYRTNIKKTPCQGIYRKLCTSASCSILTIMQHGNTCSINVPPESSLRYPHKRINEIHSDQSGRDMNIQYHSSVPAGQSHHVGVR